MMQSYLCHGWPQVLLSFFPVYHSGRVLYSLEGTNVAPTLLASQPPPPCTCTIAGSQPTPLVQLNDLSRIVGLSLLHILHPCDFHP